MASTGALPKSSPSINDQFSDEILLLIFSHLPFAWAWAHTCPAWYALIRSVGWNSLEIRCKHRDNNLYRSISNPAYPQSPPLRFLRHLDWYQCHCHSHELLYLPGLDKLQTLLFRGFDVDSPLSILSHFRSLMSLILTGWQDGTEQKNQLVEFETELLTEFFPSTLTSLSLSRLEHRALQAVCSWTSRHGTSQASPPVSELTLRLNSIAELPTALPLIQCFSASLKTLNVTVIDSKQHYFDLQEALSLPLLQALHLVAGECLLRNILHHFEIPALVSIILPQSSGSGHNPPDHDLCRIEEPLFQWTFPFDLFEQASPERLTIRCPCSQLEGHNSHYVSRFINCGEKVLIENLTDCRDSSDSDSDSDSDDISASESRNWMHSDVATFAWDSRREHRSRLSLDPKFRRHVVRRKAVAIFTGHVQNRRWTRHVEWDSALHEQYEPHVCLQFFDDILLAHVRQ
ncbi:hypothetical protein C8J56DRAFT_1040271 [Mycena floridula]|nr:hypothetical protein C8J56DRAFT_1040271 [Mycena floridula]